MTAVPDQLLQDLLPRLQAVLPAGGQLAGLERRGADLRWTLVLGDSQLVLDARRTAQPHAPWQAGGWALTVRGSVQLSREVDAAGRALVATLASHWPDGLPTAAPSPAPNRQESTPKVSGFWREDRWLQSVAQTPPAKRDAAVQAALAALAPAPAPLHLQLYLQGACTQRCVFCTVPLERGSSVPGAALRLVADGALALLLAALQTRPGSLLTLLGDDWAAHPERDALLRQLADTPAVHVGLLGPGTQLADPALRAQVLALPNLAHLTLTLQGQPQDPAGAALHDRVVGAPGAAAQLAVAIDALCAAGRRPAVATVLVEDSLGGLEALWRWCAARGLQVAASGFVPDRSNHPAWQPAGHLPSVAALYAALAGLSAEAASAVVRLAGVPRCAVPDALASRWTGHWPSPEAEPWTYPQGGPCATCGARAVCPGVPRALAQRHGAAGLRACRG